MAYTRPVMGWVRGLIERGAESGIASNFATLMTELRTHVDIVDSDDAAAAAAAASAQQHVASSTVSSHAISAGVSGSVQPGGCKGSLAAGASHAASIAGGPIAGGSIAGGPIAGGPIAGGSIAGRVSQGSGRAWNLAAAGSSVLPLAGWSSNASAENAANSANAASSASTEAYGAAYGVSGYGVSGVGSGLRRSQSLLTHGGTRRRLHGVATHFVDDHLLDVFLPVAQALYCALDTRGFALPRVRTLSYLLSTAFVLAALQSFLALVHALAAVTRESDALLARVYTRVYTLVDLPRSVTGMLVVVCLVMGLRSLLGAGAQHVVRTRDAAAVASATAAVDTDGVLPLPPCSKFCCIL